ncbi:MAG TPA: CoA ester lyase [Clostridiales bacterium UBA8153]|nr:CoA ester lyase [Clostridiales bacterium UBA8153]
MAFRSLLFAPGNVPRRVEKAMTLAADAVILDLEDAVPISLKASARIAVAEALKQPRRMTCYVRVNSLSTGWTIDDLEAVVGPGLDGIIAPKVEDASDLGKIDWYLAHLERRHSLPPGTIDLIPLVENARGVESAFAIASAAPRVKRLVFGAVDYTADLGVELSADTPALVYARSRVVNASRAAGLEPPIDTAYLELGNPEGLVRDARTARQLGYQGKLVIHPDQIEPVNRVFTPSEEEIEFARKVVEAFARAEAVGHAAITLEGGKFIDYPVVHQARRLLQLAAQISPRPA